MPSGLLSKICWAGWLSGMLTSSKAIRPLVAFYMYLVILFTDFVEIQEISTRLKQGVCKAILIYASTNVMEIW
jgi:hypothetical protein